MLTTLAIVSLVVAGVILVVYLVVANTRGSRMGADGGPIMVACIESDASPRSCWPVTDRATDLVPAEIVPQS